MSHGRDDWLLLLCSRGVGCSSCVVVFVHEDEDASGSGMCSCVGRCAAFAFVCMLAKKMKHAAAARAAANIEEYVHDSLFVVAGGFVSDLLLTSAALASVGINMKMRWHAAAASAAAPSDRYVHDSLFVNAGVLVSVLLMTPAAFAFVGISVKMLLHAVAALAAAPRDLHVSEFLFATVGLCHVLAFCWNILDWPSRALGAFLCSGFAMLELLLHGLFPVRVRNKAVHSARKKVMTVSHRLPLRL